MKKRLFISSILMTLVLLVAITTATFAWYAASGSGTISATSSEQRQITAAQNAYTVGGNASVSCEFGAVVEKFNPSDNESPNLPTYDGTGNTFGNVHLTNDSGATYAYTPGGLVPQTVPETTDGGFSYGVAKAIITLDQTSSTILAGAVTKHNADTSSSHIKVQYEFTIDAFGNAKVLGQSAPAAKSGTNYQDRDIVLVLTINADGSYELRVKNAASALAETSTAGVWEIKFYYGLAPVHTSGTAGNADFTPDLTTEHSSADKIQVVAGSESWS